MTYSHRLVRTAALRTQHRAVAYNHCRSKHDAAVKRAWSWQLMARTPEAETVSELAQLQMGGQVADELRKLNAAKRKLAVAVLPEAVAECEQTARQVLAAEFAWEAAMIRQEEAEQIAEQNQALLRAALLRQLPSDHLSAACAVSSERKRNRTPDSQLCMRRAACVGTSAPAAPPAAVGNRHTTAQLCADQSGVSPPM
jgi:hypothetical protein